MKEGKKKKRLKQREAEEGRKEPGTAIFFNGGTGCFPVFRSHKSSVAIIEHVINACH